MRRRAKVDANQPEIVRALREAGASILHLHQLGQGAPDLLIGFRGHNILMEIKDPTQKPSQRKLTEDEIEFHNSWAGFVKVVETAHEALRLIENL
jgi:hypothetical protein